MPRLKFFGSFRSYVASREVDLAAGSLREALDQLWEANPKLRAVMADGGRLRAYVRISVNGQPVAPDPDIPLAPDDEVAVFSPVAGGQSLACFGFGGS